MIRYVTGDIFSVASVVHALVNPVNCKGVMGKGLALAFKSAYPSNYEAYRQYCGDGKLIPGGLFCYFDEERRKWIVNFATKDDWRDLSKLDWVIGGLAALHLWMMDQNIQRIAIPALGAGLGGLLWGDVKRCIENEFANTKFDVLVFEPAT